MSQPIWIANRPITREDVPLSWIAATRETRADGKVLVTRTDGFYYEIHGSGDVGFQNGDPNSAMAGASKGPYDLLVYPGYSDRQDGLAHATFLVAWRERE